MNKLLICCVLSFLLVLVVYIVVAYSQKLPPFKEKYMSSVPSNWSQDRRDEYNRMRNAGCTDIMIDTKYEGTAPACGGDSTDCKYPWSWAGIYNSKYADTGCTSGRKAVCSKMICADANPEYSGAFDKFWSGTAPTCGGGACDCVEQGAIPWKLDSCGDGKCCVTGDKQLCLKPNTMDYYNKIAYGNWLNTAGPYCQQKNILDRQLVGKGLDLAVNIAKAAAAGAGAAAVTDSGRSRQAALNTYKF